MRIYHQQEAVSRQVLLIIKVSAQKGIRYDGSFEAAERRQYSDGIRQDVPKGTTLGGRARSSGTGSCSWQMKPQGEIQIESITHTIYFALDALLISYLEILSDLERDILERDILALPCHDGGVSLLNPCTLSCQCAASARIRCPLVQQMLHQHHSMEGIRAATRQRKREAIAASRAHSVEHENRLGNCSPSLKRTVELDAERGASSWITCRPLCQHGFTLNNGAFLDALCLQYDWTRSATLHRMCVARTNFDAVHAIKST